MKILVAHAISTTFKMFRDLGVQCLDLQQLHRSESACATLFQLSSICHTAPSNSFLSRLGAMLSPCFMVGVIHNIDLLDVSPSNTGLTHQETVAFNIVLLESCRP
jgi:hypothetical protein